MGGRKMRIYLSGPITGYDIEERKRVFREACEMLQREGHDAVNPFDNGLDDTQGYKEHMREDLKLLLSCDCIAFLPGWKWSNGCQVERTVAMECGIEEYKWKMINDMMPGEVRHLGDGTPIEFTAITNIESMDHPCEGCVFENEDCKQFRTQLGACDAMDREDNLWGIFTRHQSNEQYSTIW